MQKPLGFGSFLLEQVLANQHLHQLVPVDLADHAPGVVVIRDIGGILGQQVADDLVDGIIAFFGQGFIHTPKDSAHIFPIVVWYSELLRIFFGHGIQPPSKRM